MTYSEKLRDPRWQKKRLEVFQRDDFKCIACGVSTKTLHVHHRDYHGDPWDAPLDDLETLCEECHSTVTAFQKEAIPDLKKLPSEKTVRFAEALRAFSELFPGASAVNVAIAALTAACEAKLQSEHIPRSEWKEDASRSTTYAGGH